MLRNNTQNKRLHALITKLSIDAEAKEELVYNFTGTRETSTSKMEVSECQNLINHLEVATRNLVPAIPKGNGNPNKADKMRKKILSICYEMNWTNEKGKINWKTLNDYLLKFGYLHKALNDYKEAELPTLVSQFEGLLKQFYKKL
jgi:hypothetical protein